MCALQIKSTAQGPVLNVRLDIRFANINLAIWPNATQTLSSLVTYSRGLKGKLITGG